MKEQRSSTRSTAQAAIGGPALWLGLACALGTGILSREAQTRILAFLGLPSFSLGSVPDLRVLLPHVLVLGIGGVWFLLIWGGLAWRCRTQPEYPRWRWSILLIYVSASAYFTLTISVSFLYTLFSHSDSLVPICAAYFLSSIGLGALLFAVRNPVDGFFCAGLSCLILFQFFGDPGATNIHPGYFATAAMGVSFAYVYGGLWSHVALACLGLIPIAFALLSTWKRSLPTTILLGLVLLHGAILGSVIWLIRKGVGRIRKRGRTEVRPEAGQ